MGPGEPTDPTDRSFHAYGRKEAPSFWPASEVVPPQTSSSEPVQTADCRIRPLRGPPGTGCHRSPAGSERPPTGGGSGVAPLSPVAVAPAPLSSVAVAPALSS